MTRTMFNEKHPIYTITIGKDETEYKNAEEIIDFLNTKIQNDPIAEFITIFDHYKHTSSLEIGEINPEFKNALNIIFCFGPKIPNAEILAVRPRSIGVVEKEDNFIITFMEAPKEDITQKLIGWIKELKK